MAVYNDGYDNEEERKADLAWEYRKGGPNDPNLYAEEEPEEDAEEEEEEEGPCTAEHCTEEGCENCAGYEPTGGRKKLPEEVRLIDAEAIKRKFQDRSYWTYTHEYGDAIPIDWIMSGIDNAPTVDKVINVYPTGEVIVQEKRPQDALQYSAGYQDGYLEAKKLYESPRKEAPAVEARPDPNDIYFLCDHKRCGENFNCYACNHTTDIKHAVNFELVEFPRSAFFERARPHGEWIAVKDKLPDTDGEYLVSLDNGRIVTADGRGIIENHDFAPKMLAWRPLPEPYCATGGDPA